MLLGKIHKFKEKLASLCMSMKLCLLHALLSLKGMGYSVFGWKSNYKKTSPFLVGFLYRNPSEPANWTDKFVSMMDVVWLESKEIIFMGDFNIDLSKTNKPWTDVFSLFNLSQTVSSPTRVTPSSKTLIDHIYSTECQ